MKYTEKIARETKDPKILVEILRRGNNDLTSCEAARNPNCPPEILVEILKRGKNDRASYYAALYNPNCPDESKIKWMQVVGKIVKEDPSKHIIEYEKIKEDDFQDLKDLLKLF